MQLAKNTLRAVLRNSLGRNGIVQVPDDLCEAFEIDQPEAAMQVEDAASRRSCLRQIRDLTADCRDVIGPGDHFHCDPEPDGLSLVLFEEEGSRQPLGYVSLSIEAGFDRRERHLDLGATIQAVFVDVEVRDRGYGRLLAAGSAALIEKFLERAITALPELPAGVSVEIHGEGVSAGGRAFLRKMAEVMTDRIHAFELSFLEEPLDPVA